jgi:hypothetical protein
VPLTLSTYKGKKGKEKIKPEKQNKRQEEIISR